MNNKRDPPLGRIVCIHSVPGIDNRSLARRLEKYYSPYSTYLDPTDLQWRPAAAKLIAAVTACLNEGEVVVIPLPEDGARLADLFSRLAQDLNIGFHAVTPEHSKQKEKFQQETETFVAMLSRSVTEHPLPLPSNFVYAPRKNPRNFTP